MKRRNKIRMTAEAVRVLLDIFKEAHNLSEYAERFEESSCNGCYPEDGDIYDDDNWKNWCKNCKDFKKDMPVGIMIELLDHNRKRISANCLSNSSDTSAHWWDNENCSTRMLSDHFNVDLRHITWGADADALAKTRYVRVFTRSETGCGEELLAVDRGYELNINARVYSNFVRTSYGGEILNEYVY